MNFLLPNRFKKMGLMALPSGLALWLLMQSGTVKSLLIAAFGPAAKPYAWSGYHITEMALAILGFFGFLVGLFFISFSKEKVEDELVRKMRTESFQMAAVVQLLTALAGFIAMAVLGEPEEGGMLVFLLGLVLLFWCAFIIRFNYIVHYKFG